MPFKIVKHGDKFRLFNLHKKTFAGTNEGGKPLNFNTFKAAQSAGLNFIRYREKVRGRLSGNYVLDK